MIDFAEFLMLLSILAGEAEETSSIKKVKLGQVSFYSRSALIRWIRNDGDLNPLAQECLDRGLRASSH